MKTIKINLRELMKKKMDKKHAERKIKLIWMEEKMKYRIKINIDNRATEKADKKNLKKQLSKNKCPHVKIDARYTGKYKDRFFII